MADGSVKIKIEAESKKLKKDLAVAEKEVQKTSKTLERLEANLAKTEKSHADQVRKVAQEESKLAKIQASRTKANITLSASQEKSKKVMQTLNAALKEEAALEKKAHEAKEAKERSAYGGKTEKEAKARLDAIKERINTEKKSYDELGKTLDKFTGKQKKGMEALTKYELGTKHPMLAKEQQIQKKYGFSAQDYKDYTAATAGQYKSKGAQASLSGLLKREQEKFDLNKQSIAGPSVEEEAAAKALEKQNALVSKLQEKYATISAQVEKNKAAVEGQNAAVSEQESKVEGVKERVASLTQEERETKEAIEQQKAALVEQEAIIPQIQKKLDHVQGIAHKIVLTLANLSKRGLIGLGKGVSKFLLSPFTAFGRSLTGLNKKLSSFKKRLKNAVIQGLLLRPLREAFFGIYTAVSNATKQNAAFQASLANLKGTLWTVLAPTLDAVIPIITKVMNAVATLITYISSLATVLFKLKPASKSAGKALAASAKKSGGGKDDKNFASWDTVQQLQKKQAGGAEEPVAPTFEQDFEKADAALAKIKEAILADDWFKVGTLVGEKLNDLISTLNNWITSKFTPFIEHFSKSFADLLNGMVYSVDFHLMGETLANGLNGVLSSVFLFFDTFDGTAFGDKISALINGFFEQFDVQMAASALTAFVQDLFGFFIGLIEGTNWKLIGQKVMEFLVSIDWGAVASSLFEAIGAALGGLAAFLWGAISKPWNTVVEWWSNLMKEESAEDILQGLFDGLIDAIAGIGKWIKEHIFTPFINGFKNAFGIHSPSTVMKEQGGFIIEGMLNGIKEKLTSIGTWIRKHIFDPVINGVKNVFGITNNSSSKMKAVGSAISEGLKSGIASGIDKIKSVINMIIETVETAVNWIIEKINLLSWEVPDWVPAIGGETFGFHVSPVQIPRLAQGAVVNPGHEFAAILGDNRREQEIVSPLSTMKEALSEALQESGLGRGRVVNLQVDGRTFATLTAPYMLSENTRVGIRATGG